MDHNIIIGAGECGTRAAFALREAGFQGRITLIGDEPHLPYERPPLSKPDNGAAQLKLICTLDALQSNDIDYLQGITVSSINPQARSVALSDGGVATYDRLLLATGSRPRRMACPGADRILYFRSHADAHAIFSRAKPGSHVAVIGGGLIGMELAAVLRRKDVAVSVVEAAPKPFGRAVPTTFAEMLYQRHLAEGVQFHLGQGVAAIDAKGIILVDGTRVDADLVVAAVGVLPNVELAGAAGLSIANGILTDPCLRTSSLGIYAAGDCALVAQPGGGHLRFESWRAARAQAETAARNMVGATETFAALSWFWSDQYDLGLQVVGFPQAGHDVVTRQLPNGSIEFYLENGRLVAAAGLATGATVAKDIKLSEMLIEAGATPDAALLANPGCNLKAMLKQAKVA